MSWSLGEIRALSVKAARGAGMDWGIAEEAGFVVNWLEAHGLQGAKSLAQYLYKVQKPNGFEYEHCPLKLGCLISDTNDWNELQGKTVHEPLLLAPFIANVLGDESLILSWDNNSITIQKNGVTAKNLNALDTQQHVLKAILSENTSDILSNKTRVSEEAEPHVAILNTLAHKTYAPSTEASRLAGAGAGLNDND